MAHAQESFLSTDGIKGNSKWGQSFFSLAGVDAQAVNQGTPAAYAYNYLSLNYKLNAKERINFRPAFTVHTAGYQGNGDFQESKTALADVYINYKRKDLALLPGDWAVSGEARVFFPTSESTRDKKTITYIQGKIISERLLSNGWSATYMNETKYYFQSQKAYRYVKKFADGGQVVQARANQIAEIEHSMALMKYVNKVFSPGVEAGFVHEYYYTSDQIRGGNASSNELAVGPKTEIHLNRDVWFILSAQSKVQLNNTRFAGRWQDERGQSINLFHPENTQYNLFTFIAL